MRTRLSNVLLVAGLVAVLCAPALSGPLPAPNAPPVLKVGDAAPDFTLDYFDGHDLKKVSLHDYQGKKNVVLAFYIFAFTGG
jgi:cytochrome oxidase Cu insertion factor (SCO1/SenC/PrrC family)